MPHIPGHVLTEGELEFQRLMGSGATPAQSKGQREFQTLTQQRPTQGAPGVIRRSLGQLGSQISANPILKPFVTAGQAVLENVLPPIGRGLTLAFDPFAEALAAETERVTASYNIIAAERALGSTDAVQSMRAAELLPQFRLDLQKADATRQLEKEFVTGTGDLSGPELAGQLRSQFQERTPSEQIFFGVIADPIGVLPIGAAIKGTRAGIRGLQGAQQTRRLREFRNIPAPAQAVTRDIGEVFPAPRGPMLPPGPEAPLALPPGPRPMPPAGAVIEDVSTARVLPPTGGAPATVERPFVLSADELAQKMSIGRTARPVAEPITAPPSPTTPRAGTTSGTTRITIGSGTSEFTSEGALTSERLAQGVREARASGAAQQVADIPPPARPRKVTPTPDGTLVEPSSAETAFLGLEPHIVGLSRRQRVMNSIANMLGVKRARGITSLFGTGRTQADPIVNPVVSIATEAVKRADDLARVEQTSLNRAINRAFKFSDDGTFRIPDLAGVESRRPGGPTLRTVAARLPLYRDRLSPQQIDVLEQIKETLLNPRETYNQFPIRDAQTSKITRGVPASAPDILEDGGGFYVPLGAADSEQLDLPSKIISIGRRGGRTTTGAERGRVFTGTPDGPLNALTQEEAIETLGYRYDHPATVIGGFIQESGHRAATRYIGDSLRQYGQTPKQIAKLLDPELFREIAIMQNQLQRLRQLGLKLPTRQSDKVRAFFDDPTFDDINAVFDAVDKPIQRGQFIGANVQELESLRKATKARIAAIRPSYNKLMERARNVRAVDGEAVAGIENPLLANRKFPLAMADAANDQIQRMTPPGRFPVIGDFDALYSGFRATADDSAIAIQGWLALFDNPIRWGRTVAGHYRGFYDLDALGAFVDQRNLIGSRTVRIGDRSEVMPRVQDLISRAGLRAQARRSAAAVTRGEEAGISDLVFTKGKFNPFARLNNLFSLFGDRIRIDTMYDDITDMLVSGKTMDDLWRSGDMQGIAKAVNTTTGFVDSTFGGPAGRRFLFAARWLQSRMEVVVEGVGAIRDPRILIETLPAGQRIARASSLSTKQRLVGRRFWRLMNYGTALTVGLNEWAKADPESASQLGFEINPTYLQPRVNGRVNSNFMKVRWFGRDISAYGPFHSIYNLMHRAVTGRPDQAIRSLTSGSVQNAWDLISIGAGQGDFRARSELGEKAVINTIEKFTGERPDPNKSKLIQIGGRLLENFMTFNTEEAFESAETIAEGDIARGSVGVAMELAGVQSSLLSPSDLADRHAKLEHLPSIDSAESYQRRISFSFADVEARREGFPINRHQARIQDAYNTLDARVEELITGKNSKGEQVISPRVSLKDRAFLYLDARGKLFDQLEVLKEFDTSKFPEPLKALDRREVVTVEDALDAWHALRKMPSSINPRRGQPGGDPLETNRQAFLNHRNLRAEQRDYVIRNTNITMPPKSIMTGLRRASRRTWKRIVDSQEARRKHLRSIGADPNLVETLRILP